jgi:hypothetical protein
MTAINLNKLPIISNEKGWLKYDPFQEFPELKNLGEISERIYGCAHFNGGKADGIYPEFAEKAYLRASLEELVSLSEMLKRKCPEISIENTDLPILHFFKELRVTNFHLKSSNSHKITGRAVIVNSITNERNSEEFDVNNLVIENCSIDLFTDNKNYVKYYNSAEFKETVKWVEEHQKIWGVSHIIESALKQYCEQIKQHCK